MVNELETERLRLRRFTEGDGEFMLALLNDPDFVRNVGDRGLRTVEDACRYIAERISPGYDRGFGGWAVELKDLRTPIGMCSLLERLGLRFERTVVDPTDGAEAGLYAKES